MAQDLLLHAVPGLFAIARCRGCGLFSIQPPPSADLLRSAYPAAYEPYQSGSDIGTSPLPQFWDQVFPRRGMRVLDVGCGGGRYLDRLRRKGCEVWGIEPDPHACEAVRRLGIPIHVGTIEDAPFPPPRFDVVSFVHVIEHVPHPVQTLCRAAELLAPGGKIFLLTPNAGSWTFRFFREAWYPLDAPRHLNLFTADTLREACRRAGLQVKGLQVHQRPKDILRSIQRCGRLGAAVSDSRPVRLAARLASKTLAWFLRSGDELRLVAGAAGKASPRQRASPPKDAGGRPGRP